MPEYHFWHNLTYLGRNDVVKNEGHKHRVGGQLQAKIRPCATHQQDSNLIWYGNCEKCLGNYNEDNEWMFDYG
jgi:hypothetical protein